MKLIYTFTITLLCCFSVIAQESDALSNDKELLLKLQMEVDHLKADLKKSEESLEKLLVEKEKISELRDRKLRDRIDIHLAAVVGLAIILGFIVNFFGKQAIQKYINDQAVNLTKKKIDEVLTSDFLKQELRLKAEKPLQNAVDELKEEFLKISDKTLGEERRRIRKQNDEMLEKLQKDLETLRVAQKADNQLSAEEKKKVEQYEKTLKETREEQDFTAQDWFWKGKAASDRENYNEAIEAYSESIKLNPKNDSAWNNRAYAKTEIKLFDQAIEDANEAIKLNPKNDSAWNNRAYAKTEIKLFDQAIEDANEAIKLNPKNDSAWNNRAYAKNMLKLFDQAIEDANEAVKLNPTHVNSYAHRAYSYMQLDDMEKAISDIEKSQELDDTYNKGWYYLGLIRQKQDRMNEACEAWKKAVELGLDEAQEMLDKYCPDS